MMSSYLSQREAAVLQLVLPNLEAEGYEVFLDPSPATLPPFMRACRPDAIAVRTDKKLAIEVMAETGRQDDKLARLRSVLSGHEDWELRVFYAPPVTPAAPDFVMPRDLVEENLGRLIEVFDQSGSVAGLLLAWSVFEAIAHIVVPEQFARSRAPGVLVEALASNGYLTPDDADMVRTLGQLRNDAAHGRLDVTLTREKFKEFVEVARDLLLDTGD